MSYPYLQGYDDYLLKGSDEDCIDGDELCRRWESACEDVCYSDLIDSIKSAMKDNGLDIEPQKLEALEKMIQDATEKMLESAWGI